MHRFILLAVLCGIVLVPASAAVTVENRTLDGSNNNVVAGRTDWGQLGRQYLRVAPANYIDGKKKPVLSNFPTRFISNRVFNDTGQNLFSENDVSQWGWTWGQFIDHNIGLRDETPGEDRTINFAEDDPLEDFVNDFDGIDFHRTPAAPGTGTTTVRQQINTVSSYIDGFAVYGGTEARLEWLRNGSVDNNVTNNGARLMLPDQYLPRASARPEPAPAMGLMGRLVGEPDRAVIAGDVRANENVALTAVHTLFAREHNRIVGLLPTSLSGEERFQIARRVVGAEIQFVTYNEFLPALGVNLSPYVAYNPNVNATLSNEFAVVGYRAHSMIHGEFEPIVPVGTYSDEQLEAFEDQGIEIEEGPGANEITLVIPLVVAFGNPDLLQSVGIGRFLRSLGTEAQYKNDEQIDNALRSVLFQVPKPGVPDPSVCGTPVIDPDCFTGVVDLGAIDIERGRDHGMPYYNALRQAYGLAPKSSFTAITGESTAEFPSDPEIDPANPIDDPDILDFTAVFDGDGNPIPLGEEGAVTGTRRSTLAARLKAVYRNINRMDAFTGMVSERHVAGTEFGELQLAIWKKQFEALRDGDRFFYGNEPERLVLLGIRDAYGIDYRRKLSDIIRLNTNTTVQNDVFKVEDDTDTPPGPVAAYAFDANEASATDATGNGHTGTIAGATWTASGKNGGALSFDGVNDWVTVADAADLDLTNGMTLEAWVRPNALGLIGRTVVLKEQPAGLVYGLYAASGGPGPDGVVSLGGTYHDALGPAPIALGSWTHLAAVYDGATVRLHVNGVQVASVPGTGSMPSSSGPLRMGGNSIWTEWFAGLLDDVRVYDRPLSVTEIQADMATRV